jgi:hypothetical protein
MRLIDPLAHAGYLGLSRNMRVMGDRCKQRDVFLRELDSLVGLTSTRSASEFGSNPTYY